MSTEKKIRLTPAQWDLLDRICKSNGGGVFGGFFENDRDMKIMRKLESLGLIQGKSGHLSRAVHTREGLDYWRARTTGQEKGD